jgi:hypothetical protein
LCIADVSGKSARAQARLPLLKYSLRALAPLYDAPEKLVDRLNETLAPDLGPELFIALCYVILDPQRSRLMWCNAGHIAPLLISRQTTAAASNSASANDPLLELGANGPPLGMFPELPYRSGSLPWCPGDELLMFTDGLTDAFSYGASEDGEAQVRHLAARLMAAPTPPGEVAAPADPPKNATELRPVRAVAQELVDLATTVLDVTEVKPGGLRSLLPALHRGKAVSGGPRPPHRDDVTVVLARFRRPAPAVAEPDKLSLKKV